MNADNKPTYTELVQALEEMVNQHCSTDGGKNKGEIYLDSMALRANHDAMKLLERMNTIVIESEAGRRIIAHWNFP